MCLSKYRAWATDEEKMYENVVVTGNLIHLSWSEGGYEFTDFISEWSAYYDENVYTVMEQLSKLDKDSTSIYEGDILEYEDDKYYVEYDNDAEVFTLKNLDKTYAGLVAEYHLYTMKIIGNIYENKDMLRTNTECNPLF